MCHFLKIDVSFVSEVFERSQPSLKSAEATRAGENCGELRQLCVNGVVDAYWRLQRTSEPANRSTVVDSTLYTVYRRLVYWLCTGSTVF